MCQAVLAWPIVGYAFHQISEVACVLLLNWNKKWILYNDTFYCLSVDVNLEESDITIANS